MSKRYHISTSIDGLLRKTDKELSRLFFGDGKVIRDELLKRKLAGEKLIGSSDCDNFNPISGCQGHEIKE